MEINEVKIDRCFVSGLQHSVYNCRLISNMIELSHSEQLRVCCEGVETEEELAVLRTLHPDLLQGYLFSKPYEAETFARHYIRGDSEEHSQWEAYRKRLYQLSGGEKTQEMPERACEQGNIIEEMEKQALYVTKEIFCTDKIVNGVVSEKNGEAKNKNIEFRVNIEPTADLTFLDDIDKIGILGNLLDNAMEAAGKCRDNKSVALDIYTSNNNHFIVLNIQNTSETAPLKKGTRFLSTKKNQENHGIGLEYVKNIVAKYQGFLNIKYEDGVYYVRVIIPKYKR